MSLLLAFVGPAPTPGTFAIPVRSPWFDFTPEAPRGSFTVGYQVTAAAPTLTFSPAITRPFQFIDPDPPKGWISTGYVVTVAAPTVNYVARVVATAIPDALAPTGWFRTGLVPPAAPIVPTIGWRITPAQFQPDPLPTGFIFTGYVVTTPVIPPATPSTGGGVYPNNWPRIEPMLTDPDEEAVILALLLL